MIYGLVHSYDTWNPLYLQFGAYWELCKRFYHTEGLKHKLCVLFMGPSWLPGTSRFGNGYPEVWSNIIITNDYSNHWVMSLLSGGL